MGAIAAAVSAMLVLSGQVYDLMPDWATAAELEDVRIELAGGVQQNAASVLGIQRRDTQRSLAELKVRIGQAQPTAAQQELLRLYLDDLERIDAALRALQ